MSSWHERNETYTQVKSDIAIGRLELRRRYKVFVAAQVTATAKLVCGEDLFIKLMTDFEVRRGFAVWLNPDVSSRTPFAVSPNFASFMSTRREVSALAIDSLALKPSAAPKTNSINARLLTDLLFRA